MHLAEIAWRKSSRSSNNGTCVEVGCIHDAPWRKSSRSNDSGGECVEAAHLATTIAVRDSKLDTTGDFPTLTMAPSDWTALLHTLR